MSANSTAEPAKYYDNNVGGSAKLLKACATFGCNNFVFSSTCATYGVPAWMPLTEDAPQNPVNPYGYTKLVVERMLRDAEAASGIRHVALRYFNAAGADPDGEIGEAHDPETHIIPLVLFAAMGRRPAIDIFGDDYPTPDGTCIRDYVHVSDLADAHVAAIERLAAGHPSDVFNLGNGHGFSVADVMATAERVTGRTVQTEHVPAACRRSSRADQRFEQGPRAALLDAAVSLARRADRPCLVVAARRHEPGPSVRAGPLCHLMSADLRPMPAAAFTPRGRGTPGSHRPRPGSAGARRRRAAARARPRSAS